MKRHALFLFCCLVTLFAGAAAFAQGTNGRAQQGANGQGQFGYGFTGPGQPGYAGRYGYTGPVQTVTVAQARSFGHRTPVVVTGKIVQAIGGDLFMFSDSSGEIVLRIGPKEWMYFGSTIGPQDTIEISGEIHWPRHSWNVPELHARFMRKL